MKSLITALSFIALFTVTTSTHATSIQYAGVAANLTNIELGQDFPHQTASPFDRGTIKINHQTGYIQLSLAGPTFKCLKHTACSLPTSNVNINLQLTSVHKSSCGDTYTAQGSIKTQTDGPIETIIVTDYSNATCTIRVPALTVVQYYYQVGGVETYGHSQFYANQLISYLGTFNRY